MKALMRKREINTNIKTRQQLSIIPTPARSSGRHEAEWTDWDAYTDWLVSKPTAGKRRADTTMENS